MNHERKQIQAELKLTSPLSPEEIRRKKAEHVWDRMRSACPKRYDAFTEVGDSDKTLAIARCLWNIQLAEAIAPSIAVLEVLLRNNIDQAFRKKTKNDFWFTTPTHQLEIKPVNIVREELINRGHGDLNTIDRNIWLSTFSFRYWCLMLEDWHSPTVWDPHFEARMKNSPNTKLHSLSQVRKLVNEVRGIRNRAFHHEPLWRKPTNFREVHTDMRDLISALNGSAGRTLGWVDRFPDVYDNGFSQIHSRVIAELSDPAQ